MKMFFNERMIQGTSPKSICIRVPDSNLSFWHARKNCKRENDYPGSFSCWIKDVTWILYMKEERVVEPYDLLDEWTGTVAEAIEQFGLFVGE